LVSIPDVDHEERLHSIFRYLENPASSRGDLTGRWPR
jgi:hypothetical protein